MAVATATNARVAGGSRVLPRQGRGWAHAAREAQRVARDALRGRGEKAHGRASTDENAAGVAPEDRRIHGVDLARGLAVVGMFAAHLVVTAPMLRWSDPSTWNGVVNGSPSILFGTLAGVSLGLVTGGAAPHTATRLAVDRRRIALRAGIIFVIGFLLQLLPTPVYVILPAYAILFLLALPLLSWRPGWLLAFAGVVAVAAPFAVLAIDRLAFWESTDGQLLSLVIGWHYPFVAWIAFVAAGLALARIGLSRPIVVAAIGLVAAGVAPVGFGIVGRSTHAALTATPHETGVGETLGSGGLAIAVICGSVLLCRTPPIALILWPIRAVGSMPLTAYTAQLVAWGVWAWAQPHPEVAMFDLRGTSAFLTMTLATIAGCSLWSAFVGRGPLERLVAVATKRVVARR